MGLHPNGFQDRPVMATSVRFHKKLLNFRCKIKQKAFCRNICRILRFALFIVENVNRSQSNKTTAILARFKAILQANRAFVGKAVKRL